MVARFLYKKDADKYNAKRWCVLAQNNCRGKRRRQHGFFATCYDDHVKKEEERRRTFYLLQTYTVGVSMKLQKKEKRIINTIATTSIFADVII